MQLDRSVKTLIAVATLVAATFLMMNHIIDSAPVADWWLAGILFAISVGFWVWIWQEDQSSTALALGDDAGLGQIQEWIISGDQLTSSPALEKPLPVGEPAVGEVKAADDLPEPEEQPEGEIDPADDQIAEVIEEVVEGTPDDPAEIVEEAKEGAEIAEVELADAMAGGPTGTTGEVAEENVEIVEEEIAGEEITREDQEIRETPSAPEPDESGEAASDDADSQETEARIQDLTRIEGIGPKYRDALIEAGLRRFEDIAASSEEQLTEIIREAGMRKPPSVGTWVKQAGFAARKDWNGLDKLQKELVGGRRTDD